MTDRPFPTLWTAALTCALAGHVLVAQESRPDGPDRASPDRRRVERLSDWPELTPAQERRAKLMLRRLVDDEEQRRTEAARELREIGAGIGKLALRKITPRKPELHAPIFAALDDVTDERHVPILAREATHRLPEVRRWAIGKLARLHPDDAAAVYRHALDEDEEDDEVRFRAALGLAGLGDWEHFDLVFERMRHDPRQVADLVSEVLVVQRGDEGTRQVLSRMHMDEESTVLAGMRLLRSLAAEHSAARLSTFLDAPSAQIKKETINTLRVIVDGDEPDESLSAFQVIGEAKKWKERLQ